MKIHQALSKFRTTVVQEIEKAVHQATHLLQDRVEPNAPTDSVESVPNNHDQFISSLVVVDSDHALPLEYGTRYMAAQPYFRPAIASSIGEMREMIARVAKP